MTGDMTEGFKQMNEAKKQRHQQWNKNNQEILRNQLDFPYKITNDGETCLFRIAGKPRVNFYPSTGRWTNLETMEVMHGGATAFLRWFKKQESEQ